MVPASLPLFPLPTTVLFPNVFLPLHIFEPRYRQMVGDALSGDRLIGMTLLQPGYESDYEGRPPIYPVGCSGVITHVERLADGRFNLILRGLQKFRILVEEPPSPDVRLYRRAAIELVEETVSEADRGALRQQRLRLEALLDPLLKAAAAERHATDAMADEDLVNALAQYLEFEPLEKQALLERAGALSRCQSIIELLEMKALIDKAPGDGGSVH
jgi:Lon protease-like protein